MTLLSVKNINKQINEKSILKNLSFDLNEGEFLALIGPNGSGKSTLARIISHLDKYQGEIYIDGTLINEKTESLLRSTIGIVFQNPDNQFIGNTVEDDLAFGLENQKLSRVEMKDKVERMLEEIEMIPYRNFEPSKLSGGQKQKVALASVLIMEPKLIIFDEATSMLDPSSKKEVQSLIKKIRRERRDLSIIYITHDLEELKNEVTRIILLEGGEIIQDALKDEVYQTILKAPQPSVKIPLNEEIRIKTKTESLDPKELVKQLWESV